MKILFLDIDGVVNSRSTSNFHEPYPIDPHMALLIARIKLSTGCDVVLSSSWRYDPEGFKNVSQRVVELLDVTPCLGTIRGEEIKAWLNAHPEVNKYAILDDDSDMLNEQFPNFFKTTFYEGLNDEIADKVIEHLNA